MNSSKGITNKRKAMWAILLSIFVIFVTSCLILYKRVQDLEILATTMGVSSISMIKNEVSDERRSGELVDAYLSFFREEFGVGRRSAFVVFRIKKHFGDNIKNHLSDENNKFYDDVIKEWSQKSVGFIDQ